MARQDESGLTADSSSGSTPFDNIRTLRVAPIDRLPVRIATTAIADAPALMTGEVQVDGQVNMDALMVQRVRRIALYGVLDNPASDGRLGIVSLVGPLDDAVSPLGNATDVVLQLHYEALSTELKPLRTSWTSKPDRLPGRKEAGTFEDAVFPQVETVRARLRWNAQAPSAGGVPVLQLNLELQGLVKKHPGFGYVQGLTFAAPTSLPFYPAGTGQIGRDPHHSLQTGNAPSGGACSAGHDTVVRDVRKLRFVNFALRDNDPGLGALETLMQQQINGIDQIWGQKAALQFDVQPNMAQGDDHQVDTYHFLAADQETDFRHPMAGRVSEDPSTVQIYVIEQFADDPHGGGIAYDCGVPSTYCILDSGFMAINPFLLAHELGHMLGLDHPGGGSAFAGSANSVLQPAMVNSQVNTLHNCKIFVGRQAATLNPIVTMPALSAPGCFNTDRDN